MAYGELYREFIRKKRLGVPISRSEMSGLVTPSLLAEARARAESNRYNREFNYRENQSKIQQGQFEDAQDAAKKAQQTQTYSDLAKTGLMTYAYGKGQGWWGGGGNTITPTSTTPPLAYSPTGQAYQPGLMQPDPYTYAGDPTSTSTISTVEASGGGAGATGVAEPATATSPSTGLLSYLPRLGVTAAIAAQNYMAGNTNTYIDGQKTGGAMQGLTGDRRTMTARTNDPWQGYAADKMGVEPTAQEKFDAAQANRDRSGMFQYAGQTFHQWAQPGTQLISSGWASKATGYKYDPEDPDGGAHEREYKMAQAFIDPGSRLVEELGDSSTVICTELHRQGYLSDELYELDALFGRMMNPVVHIGYRKMADPVVALMKKSKVFTWIVSKLALPWASEMGHIMKPDISKGHWLGRIIMKAGIPLCQWVGKREVNLAWD